MENSNNPIKARQLMAQNLQEWISPQDKEPKPAEVFAEGKGNTE